MIGMCVYIYIYIYRERERLHIQIYIYTYTCTYIERKREICGPGPDHEDARAGWWASARGGARRCEDAK